MPGVISSKNASAARSPRSEQSSPTSVAALSPRGMAPRPSFLRPPRSTPRRSTAVSRSKSVGRNASAMSLSPHSATYSARTPLEFATTPRNSSVPLKPSSAPSSRRSSLYRSSPTTRELKALMERAERDEVISI